MILKAQLEYRGYKETEYDLTAQGGPKGISKTLTFLTDDDDKLLFSRPDDVVIDFSVLKKGVMCDVTFDAVLKPYVNKETDRVNYKNFAARFSVVDVVPVGFVPADSIPFDAAYPDASSVKSDSKSKK